MKHVSRITGLVILFAALVACTQPLQNTQSLQEPVISFDEFCKNIVRPFVIDGETRYLIEGDIIAYSLDDVKNYYDALMTSTVNNKSTVNVIVSNGKRYADIYNATVRTNITYKIDSAISSTVRTDIAWALSQWESICGVKFNNVTGTTQTALFTIRNATAAEEQQLSGVVASAFFPSYSKKELILFDDFYNLFANGQTFYGWDQKAVLLHELGHGIGLRHEFIWSKSWYSSSWTQTGETSAPAYLITTNRDDYSIMYYPQYSAYKGNGRFSAGDKQGAAWCYPKN